jgi:predicted amidohydrolase YtcJ
MTIWAAKSSFEENENGSLEPGKYADFVILDTYLMTATPQEILMQKLKAHGLRGKWYLRNGKNKGCSF